MKTVGRYPTPRKGGQAPLDPHFASHGLTDIIVRPRNAQIGVKGSLSPLAGCGAAPHGFYLLTLMFVFFRLLHAFYGYPVFLCVVP